MEEFKESYKDPIHDFNNQRVDLPKSFTLISCPSCDSGIPADNLNINDKIGKCSSCQAVFSIENEIQNLQLTKQKIRQELLRPEGIEVFHFKEELEISFEQPIVWMEWILLTLIMIFWLPGILASIERSTFIPFVFFGLLPTLIGTIYYFRRNDKHRKYITIDEDYLSVLWRPRKFKTNQRYRINDISQLYVKYNPNIGYWQVNAIVDEGLGQKHVTLTSLKTVSKAKYLEQVLENHLGIQDVVVPEES